MSKAGDIIDKVKRHQFWILCGVVSLVGLVSWWMATRSLAKEYTQGKSKIESEHGKIVVVQGIPDHPNEKWNIKVNEIVERERKDVETAWKQLYDEQKAKVFVWPVDVLEQDFVDYVEALKPGEELPDELLARYWNSLQRQFEKLAKLVDAQYEDPSQSGGVFGRERQPVVQQPVAGAVPHKVIWDQAMVQKPYDWQERPTTKQVLYAQEEIWVLTAICEAIKAANEGSAGAHDAAVQTIEEMAVGYLAAEEYPNGEKEPGRVTRVTAPATPAVSVGYGTSGPGIGIGSGGDGAEGGFGSAPGRLPRPPRPDISVTGGVQVGYGATSGGAGGPGGTAPDTSAAAPTGADDYLNEWRYVDRKSKPLGATELANSPSEYRLMPWKVRMTVDQRKWDDLLVAFRNTQLPLAIRQVRVNPTSGPAGFGFDPRGSAGGARGDGARTGYGTPAGGTRMHMPNTTGRGAYGAAGVRGIDQGFGGAGTQGSAPTITLELRGVAYLMNPPDFTKIGVGGEGAPAGDSAATSADVSAAPVTAAPVADAASGELSGVAPTPAPAPVAVPAAGGGGRR